MKKTLLAALAGILIAAAVFQPWGCRQNSNLNAVSMTIGSKEFELEVADTYTRRQTGLMYRKSMPADHGMIFVFQKPEELSFWMANTYIPLDILYLDSSGKVVSVHQMKPLDRSSVPSDGPAQYAIELNQGTAAKVGVKPGDQLQLPAEITRRK